MLRKHLKIFAGRIGKLGKALDKYAMDIDADSAEIKSQQPYHTSIRKRKLIKEAVTKLQDLGIVQESKSEIASPVVVVVQKGKPRFCTDLRKVKFKDETRSINVTATRFDIPSPCRNDIPVDS